MLESALSLPLPDKLDWGRASKVPSRTEWVAGTYAKGAEVRYQGKDYQVKVASTSAVPTTESDWIEVDLTQVDPEKPLDVIPYADPVALGNPSGYDPDATPEILKYASRDRELAYRDLVVAAASQDVSFKISTVWNFKANRMTLGGVAERTLKHVSNDALVPPVPSSVYYPKTDAVPNDALDADKYLYTRDTLLYQGLALKSRQIFDFESRNLIVSWGMDVLKDGLLVDGASPSEPHTVSGSPVIDETDQAMVFDGVDDWIDGNVSVEAIPAGPSAHTVEAWIFVEPFNEDSPSQFDILVFGHPDVGAGHHWSINSQGDLNISGITVSDASTLKIPFSAWVHIAAVYNGSSMRIYRNGALVASKAVAISLTAEDEYLCFKAGKANAAGNFFNGKIHSLRLWKGARADFDILRNYRDRFASKSPVQLIDGVGVGITSVWSTADALENEAEVHTSLPLNRDLFVKPDRNLADRDNKNAAHIARLIDIMENPYEYATRLLVEVFHPYDVTKARPAEFYVFDSEVNGERTWVAEPRLPNRMRLVYSKELKTLRWVSEDANTIHVPQAVTGLQIPGLEYEQMIRIIPREADPSMANFWSYKAKQVNFPGVIESSLENSIYPSRISAGGWKLADGSVALSHRETLTFNLEGLDITQGKNHQFLIMAKAASSVTMIGYQTVSSGLTSDDDGGVVLTNGQAALYRSRLPAGSWQMEVFYTNGDSESGTVSQLPAQIRFEGALVSALPLPYGVVPNTEKSVKFTIQSSASGFQNFTITSNTALGSLVIRRIKFTSQADPYLRYQLSAIWQGGRGIKRAEAQMFRNRHAVFVFKDYLSTVENPGEVTISVSLEVAQPLPLVITRFELQELKNITPTPNSQGFQYWKTEMLDRTGEAARGCYRSYLEDFLIRPDEVEDGINYTVVSGKVQYGDFSYAAGETFLGVEAVAYEPLENVTEVIETSYPKPEFRSKDEAGRWIWNLQSTANWLHAIQAYDEYILEAFRPARAGDIGRPALVPEGLEYNVTDGVVIGHYDAFRNFPVIRAFQPWMIEIGIRVAHENFWHPMDEDILSVSINTTAAEISVGSSNQDHITSNPTNNPPLEETPENTLGPSATNLEWSWASAEGGTKQVSITNPNAVAMKVKWSPFSHPFSGPTPNEVTIPAGDTQAFVVELDNASSVATRTITGEWEANGATGKLRGTATAL